MMNRKFWSIVLGIYFLSTGIFLAAIGSGWEGGKQTLPELLGFRVTEAADGEAAAEDGAAAAPAEEDIGSPNASPGQGESGFALSPTELGVLCVSAQYPALSLGITDSRDSEGMDILTGQSGEQEEGGAGRVISGQTGDTSGDAAGAVIGEGADGEVIVSDEGSGQTVKVGEATLYGENPRVLIIHTHGTESYLPSNESNFHKVERENTVRDVGQVMAESLSRNGISVLHDETIHDYPSYNSAYRRSGETITSILAKYPSIECVVDLHRDAAGSETPAKVINIDGKGCSVYSYVIGTSNDNYDDNLALIDKMNAIGVSEYDGFTGNIITRSYGYNQDLCKYGLLAEIGFTMNTIDESRNTAALFGEILAKALK